MRFSKYPSGTILEVSAENPDKFPVKDIERFIQLDTYLYHNKQEEAEYIRIRRSFAKIVGCPDVIIFREGELLKIVMP